MHLLSNRMAALLLLAFLAATVAFAAEPAPDEAPPEIPLQRNLRLLARPTLLGLVPPADPESYGEMFIRVTSVNLSELVLSYEVKESIAVPGSKDEATRIRRGEITVNGLGSAKGMIAPMFWPDGDLATETALIWLSRSSFLELTESESTPWELDFTQEEVPAEFHGLNEYVAELRTAAEMEQDAPVLLELSAEDALYPCLVNGERTALPVVRAVDSLGLAEYWILKDSANPLVLKMTFIPPEGSITGDEPLGLVRAGSGYAVVEIDF